MVLALVVLCGHGAFAVTNAAVEYGRDRELRANDVHAADQIVSQNHNLQREADFRPGAPQYEEASKILQSIKPPRRRLARYNQPTGIFGSSAYYAKEVFYLLFMNGPKFESKTSGRLSPFLAQAIRLLEEAASYGHEDAVFRLAEMNFYGLHSAPRNYTAAFRYYKDLAESWGNSTAQHMIGFMYATGIGAVVEPDQAKALLYHTFAADAGDVRAQMTVAYRHQYGIATPHDCEKALSYYKLVADEAMSYARSGPPGGQSMLKEAIRLADDEGGVYGEGASVSSSGENAKRAGPTHDANAAFDDVLEYLDLMSRKGELRAIFSLGRLHYDGSRVLQRNYRIAADKFFDVARRYWDRNGKIRPDTEAGVDKLASKAAGYLGRMFLRGEGLEQNFQIARVWFKRGIENGDALCQYSMGLLHLHGLGIPKDPVKAARFFGAAADQDLPAAQVRLGVLLMDQGDLDLAKKYFELASRNGHIEAYYYLAEIAQLGINGQSRNCNHAAVLYKIVAEKAEPIHSNFGEANDAYEDGDVDTAILYYLMGAEQGYEAGQANVAFLLDRTIVRTSRISRFFATFLPRLDFRLPFLALASSNVPKLPVSSVSNAAMALIYWTRSAKEQNIDSLVKMGDYYLAEIGVPATPAPRAEISSSSTSAQEQEASTKSGRKNGTNENHAKAVACYLAASETYKSAQALFNLGWMHENGIGLAQDFHLAKRYYDQAAEPPMREAMAPVALALIKLRIRSWWNWLSGGSINGIKDVDDGLKERRANRGFWEWLGEFVAADLELHDEERRAAASADELPEADHSMYMDEWGRRMNGGYGGDGEEEDWENAFGDLLETLVIVIFAALLAALVWYRQMVVMRQRQRDEQQRQVALSSQQAQLQQDQQAGVASLVGHQHPGTTEEQPTAQAPSALGEAHEDDARDLFVRGGLPDGPWGAGPGGIGH